MKIPIAEYGDPDCSQECIGFCIFRIKINRFLCKTTIRRIAWAKFFNAGQTCVAPDYCLVQDSFHDSFCKEFSQCMKQFYGVTRTYNKDIGTIVNDSHFSRLTKLITDDVLVYGGNSERKRRYIEPTLLSINDLNHPSMTGEIFGPILPIVKYDRQQGIFNTMNRYSEPLVIYCFTENTILKKRLTQKTRSGNICCNMTLHIDIFEKESKPGGRNASIDIDGYSFDMGPTFLMMTFILKDMFKRAGRDINNYLKIIPLDPMYQFIYTIVLI